MKPYMGYSRTCDGTDDGFAILIFAQDARQARSIGWQLWKSLTQGECWEAFTDFAVRWLKDAPLCIRALDHGEAYATEDVTDIACKECHMWGEKIKWGRCESCRAAGEEK